MMKFLFHILWTNEQKIWNILYNNTKVGKFIKFFFIFVIIIANYNFKIRNRLLYKYLFVWNIMKIIIINNKIK